MSKVNVIALSQPGTFTDLLTVRHRTIRAKGCMSNATAIAMVFKLIEAAQRSWRRLDGTSFLPKVIHGVKFKDGIEEEATPLDLQAGVAAA